MHCKKFLLSLFLIPVMNVWASVSVDYTCQFTEAGIHATTNDPIDKVLTRMKKNDEENHWQDCAIGGASAVTLMGDTPRELTVTEKSCHPKVFKMTFTPAAALYLNSNLNHRNPEYRRWNVTDNTKVAPPYTPYHGDKTAVHLHSSAYTVMWVGTCETIHFIFVPEAQLAPETAPICAR